jgi:hypothetical protein
MFCGFFPEMVSARRFGTLINSATQVCTAQETAQRMHTIQVGTFSADSTDAAATAVFLYIYIDKEKQYSNRSQNQRKQQEDCPRWNSA